MDEKSIEEIIKIINWYRKIPHDYNGINELMNARRKLSALAFNFSNLVVAVLSVDWKNSIAETDNKKAQLKVQYGAKGSETKADSIAKANTSIEYSNQMRLEGMYYASKSREKAIFGVVDSMNQHISNLKEELKYSRYANSDT